MAIHQITVQYDDETAQMGFDGVPANKVVALGMAMALITFIQSTLQMKPSKIVRPT